MTYTITKLPKSEIEISVKLGGDKIKKFESLALDEVKREIEIEGFRKGKAPDNIIKKKIGDAKLLERASVLAVEKTYPEIIRELTEKNEEDLEPIGAPKIEITQKITTGNFEYTARVAILPAITLPDYKSIAKTFTLSWQTPKVTEDEIEKTLDSVRESRASLVTTPKPAQKGNLVEIDFETRLDGVALANGESKNHPLTLGEGKFMPGFEEEIQGMKADEEKSFSLTAPNDYVEKGLAGKKLDFTVKVRLVQEKILPKLNDDFAKSLGNFKDLTELKTSVREGIQLEKEEKERQQARIKIVDAVAEKISTELPEMLIERELDKMMGELRSNIERVGLGWNEYLVNLKKTEDSFRKDWEKDATRRVKIALVLRKIGKLEKLNPTEEEIETTAAETMSRFGMDNEEFKKIDRAAFLEYTTSIARNEKVFKFLENQK
ncbi:MAG: trigger factor [bacterium]|nr:trigger factor [bacterium]